MNATISATTAPAAASTRMNIDWLAVAAFGLLWLEVITRLRFEWSVNPQYGYGWTVPFLAAYVFWRRWQRVPAASEPKSTLLPIGIMIAAVALLVPVRLVQ